MLKVGTAYNDLGGDFFDRLDAGRLTRYYVKRLECLGHQVTVPLHNPNFRSRNCG